VLASASPRRFELLRSVGLAFDTAASGVEETCSPGGAPSRLAQGWAEAKARRVAERFPAHWVLGADTIVVLDEVVLGKPAHEEGAVAMLERLSGRDHAVVSGICLVHRDKSFHHVEAVFTRVRFKTLSRREIRSYVASGEPLDKAGAYGIQGQGAFLVKAVYGSYTNVVGLPLCETLELLLRQGVIAPV
jgi:septum formation protein